MAAYRRLFALYGGQVSVSRIYEMVAQAPASRFFVSDLQALRVVKRMQRGLAVHTMRGARLRMYNEIKRRTDALRMCDVTMTLVDAVREVVAQPAPEMYVSPRQVAAIIDKQKRLCYEMRLKRLRHTM